MCLYKLCEVMFNNVGFMIVHTLRINWEVNTTPPNDSQGSAQMPPGPGSLSSGPENWAGCQAAFTGELACGLHNDIKEG